MRNLIRFGLVVATAFLYSKAMAALLPSHIAGAIVRTIESEYVTVSGGKEAQFIRYTPSGKLESFQCPAITAFTFYLFHSSTGGITAGMCPKDALLDETMGDQQVAGFEAAIATAGGGLDTLRKSLGDSVKPKIIHEGDNVFIHLTQWLFSGVGGMGGHGAGVLETVLMIPANSKTVVLVQGALPQNGCPPETSSHSFPLCTDFRGVLREVSRQVYAPQASPPPPRAFTLEPLRPGRPTICDSIAWAVGEALEQSDAKQIPVTETVRYKQHAGQAEIQEDMRQAADDHAKGMSISAAATRLGKQCYEKHFSKQ